MGYFAVIREAGPGWKPGKGIAGQPAVSDHAAFMDRLAAQCVVLFAGPLAGSYASSRPEASPPVRPA